MRIYSETTYGVARLRRWADTVSSRLHQRGGGEDGFLLVEVMVSAMLVAMIVVATFNGLDVATRLTAEQRRHDEASILAAQSQEQLRSEPASALTALVSSPHKYTKAVGGTTFTVTQEAKTVSASGKSTGCNVTEVTAQSGGNFQITSTVSWATQERASRPPVRATAVVTPPTGSAVEVDVTDGNNQPVSGVTAKAVFIPVESGSYNTIEGTTGASGCVVLTGIQSTKATIEIVEKLGYVTPSGALKVPPKELSIAPNITTHYAVKYAEGGRIAARFTYKGETSWEGKEVTSDTFVAAYNGGMGTEPEYETGSTAFEYQKTGEELFKPLTGSFLNTAYTAAGSRYPTGDLFPFKEKWLVYPGDCAANNTGTEARAEAGPIKNGETVSVNVPMSYTKLSIWTGTGSAKKGEATSKRYGPSKVTNTECAAAATPPNATAIAFTHEQKETLPEGRLEVPFQPFGKFSLCVANSEKNRHYTVPFTNSTVAGSTPDIFLGQRTSAEQTTKRNELKAAEEKLNTEEVAAEKAKKEREEAETAAKTAKEKREAEEAAAVKPREEREKAETAA
jgi:Tfp pilus assembly protein PilV